MLFGKPKTQALEVNINGTKIEMVEEIKFLGITIDCKLNWKTHINQIQKKISKNIYIINKIKYNVDYKSLHLLYCCLILPYLSYCIEIWGNNYKSSLDSLVRLQKRAIRIIHKVGYYDHTNILFAQSNQLKLLDLVKFCTAQLLFKVSKELLPLNIQTCFEKNQGKYHLRGDLNFKVQAARTSRKSMCVSVRGVRLWNGLEDQLKRCATLTQFKTKYKEAMLLQYKEHV